MPRPVLWILAVVAIALLWVGFAANREADDVPVAAAQAEDLLEGVDEPAPGRAAVAHGEERASRGADRRVPDADVFARVDGLGLVVPDPAPLAIAFHEASRPEALEIQPRGLMAANDNPTKFEPPADVEGHGYRVLSSRGRARSATSAVDVVMPAGSAVLAPVTGRVVEVREYALYGKTRDWRVVLEPQDRPDLHVVLVHLHQPSVQVGDTVEAGITALATVRQLPFASHVDYIVDEPSPHTHIEVKPGTPSEPLDPNAPALPPDPDSD